MNRIEPKDFSKRDLQQAMSEASADSVSDLHTHREKILTQFKTGRELRGINYPGPPLTRCFGYQRLVCCVESMGITSPPLPHKSSSSRLTI